jgi:hypothetical protein
MVHFKRHTLNHCIHNSYPFSPQDFPTAYNMAPSAIDPISSDRDGQALEGLSDNIDAVNVLKAELKKEKDMLEKPKFDAEKDKTQFRQYEVIQVLEAIFPLPYWCKRCGASTPKT